MNLMENVIIILTLLAITGGIIWYLLREKKRGKACTGCPCSGQCSHSCGK